MGLPAGAILYVPLAVWAATALSLLVALRRSGSPVVLRLAAVFLALWALLATTALLWVVTRGGWAAVESLALHPAGLFQASAWDAWRDGAIGAFAVLALVFVLNQAVGRSLLSMLHPRPVPWPSTLPAPPGRCSLMTYSSDKPEAFAFALLEIGPRFAPHRREVILLSTGLLSRLAPEEREAVIAHEWAHLVDLDGRYLTFLRTFARLTRWDPVVGHVAASLTRHEEFRADAAAVERTRRPLALARALFHSAEGSRFPVPAGLVGLLGAGGRRADRELYERIQRLVAMHESGRYAEERVGPA